MSRSINKVILVGNAGREPEVRTTAGGTKVATVSLATTRRFKRGGDFEERTEWHRLTLWDRLAEIAEQYVGRGDRLYIEGRIEYSTTEQDGQTRYWTEIVVQELVMLGGEKREAPAPKAPANPFDSSDDLPF